MLLQTTPDGREVLLSSLLVEWRKVLHAGRCVLSLELPGVGEESKLPVGVLEVGSRSHALPRPTPPHPAPPRTTPHHPALPRPPAAQVKLELLPLPAAESRLSEAEAHTSIKRERDAQVDAERRFFSYARTWWTSYVEARSEHKQRPVKIFAMSELGTQRPVTAFVSPLRADRLIESPMHAAHFVSLLSHERQHAVGSRAAGAAAGASADVWRTPLTTLTTKCGDTEEHALLLCSLLLGFGLDAYVCIGTDARGPHVWVMTTDAGGSQITFWESLTAQRFEYGVVGAAAHPYVTLACVFTHDAFYANAQYTTDLGAISLDLADPGCWKAMERPLLAALQPVPCAPLSPPTATDHAAIERELEAELRASVDAHREKLNLRSGRGVWSSHLSYLLSPALFSYEHERLSGAASGSGYFQGAIRRAVPEGHTFKALPLHFTCASSADIMRAWLDSEVATSILDCDAEAASLALRLRVFVMADDVLSVWAMLAITFRQ